MIQFFYITMMYAAIRSLEWHIQVFNSSSIHSHSVAFAQSQQVVEARQAVAVIHQRIMEESPNSILIPRYREGHSAG